MSSTAVLNAALHAKPSRGDQLFAESLDALSRTTDRRF
jgi:hypothetical protein